MLVPTIEMPTEIAQRKYDEYRGFTLAELDETEQILKRSYRYLADGKKMFNLYEVMRHAGIDHEFKPRLAIARADWRRVFFRGWESGSGTFTPDGQAWRKVLNQDLPCIKGTFPSEVKAWDQWKRLASVVPEIPLVLRPPKALSNYHILFEPQWESLPKTDPILCKRLSPNMFVILAAWDLTDLELAVMEGTL